MTTQPSTHRLDVPGASLYYEVRGSGPLVLVIGQPMTSAPFGPLADLLADGHTVVTYDPHGLGGSTVADPSVEVTPEVQADDLAHLVDAVGGGPADVFASSGGAVAGLAFAARHPDKVRTLVAHEPPVTELLPDARYIRRAVDDIEAAYRTGGAGAGWGKFLSLVVHDGEVTETGIPDVTWPPGGTDTSSGTDTAGGDSPGGDNADSDAGTNVNGDQMPLVQREKQQADDELFFLRMLKPFTRYEPDVDTLRAGAPRVVIAVGEGSRRELARRSAAALASQLGTAPATFPGDHAGFMADPGGFASRLRQVFAQSS